MCAVDLMRLIQCIYTVRIKGGFIPAFSVLPRFLLLSSSKTLCPSSSSSPLFFLLPAVFLLHFLHSLTSILSLVHQLHNVKETRQHTEEEVGAFTKLIEAMGFTGPLKYNKWVSVRSFYLQQIHNTSRPITALLSSCSYSLMWRYKTS